MRTPRKSPAPVDPVAEMLSEADGYSRREILRVAGIGGVALGAGSLLTSASAQAATRTPRAATAGWQKGRVNFVFIDTTEPNTLDPAVQTEFDSFLITRNVYDALTFTDETTNKLLPRLATSWKANPDVTQWTFKIRSGVYFSDGSPLNAAAVVTSMKRSLAIGSVSEDGYMLQGIKDVKATGPMEVVFKTEKPQPWLPYHMVKFPIVSAKALEAHRTSSDPWAKTWFATNVAGTGAYTLQSWVKGTKITLAKNTKWWAGPWKSGSIDLVTIQWESDPSTSVELIEKGVANFATEWSIDNALSVSKLKGFTLQRYKADNTDPMICFNQSKPPYDKVEVRQALQYAFDYNAMHEYFRNYAQPTVGVFPAFNPYVLKSLPKYEQNLSKAKALLAKAGVSPSQIIGMCYAAGGYPDLEAGGTILQSSIAALGGNISVQNVPFATLETDVSKESTSPELSSALYNGSHSLDPTSFLESFLPASFGNGFMHYDSPALVKAFDKASSSITAAEIRAGLNEAQQIIHDDAPVIFGALPEMLVPVPDYLDGYVMQNTDDQYPCLFFELRLRAH
jgi:peptide/nickel transport system substrate-binding protein